MRLGTKGVLMLHSVLLVGCGLCEQKKLDDTTWQLIELSGKPVTHSESDSFTLTFDSKEGRAYGRGSCNNFFYSYVVDGGDDLEFSSGGTTRMMCPDQGDEDKFFAIMNEVESYDIEDGCLVLEDDDSNRLVFKRRD